jgi:malate synthase
MVEIPAAFKALFTNELHTFLEALHRNFHRKRLDVLDKRISQYVVLPAFLPETKSIRDDIYWTGPSLVPGLIDRRVEITGPVAPRKMVINALNSNATQYMADFEDSLAPTWNNVLEGQQNLYDAVRRTICLKINEKTYVLRDSSKTPLPTLLVRPRGWHMEEQHYKVDGMAMSASLFDFGVYFFHNAAELLKRNSGPYFYLPKMESYLEARLWNEVFVFSEQRLCIPSSSIRATCLIETLPAAFQMEEILYELRQYSAGLNTGRWDYIFSFIKKFRTHPSFVMPDREHLTMTTPFLSSYSSLLVQTCHKRGVHAIGGMSAFVPIKGDNAANQRAIEKVSADKLREVKAGYDGTWALHPDFVDVARKVFDEHMKAPNQLYVPGVPTVITAGDLLTQEQLPCTITQKGIYENLRACVLYLHAWIGGTGSVAVDGLMEDLATVEISRTQLWQWRYHKIMGDNQWRNMLVSICQDNQIAMDAPVVGYIEKLMDVNVFYDFASTAIQGWKSKL